MSAEFIKKACDQIYERNTIERELDSKLMSNEA
jgi:hypothetical protein